MRIKAKDYKYETNGLRIAWSRIGNEAMRKLRGHSGACCDSSDVRRDEKAG